MHPENELILLAPRAIIAIAARLAIRVAPLVSESDEAKRVIERLFELAAGTTAIPPKIPRRPQSKHHECWGRADDILRRCEQMTKAFGEKEPGHEVTDDVRMLVAALVGDAIRTTMSFDVSEGGDVLANAIAQDIAVSEKTGGTASERMGRAVDPSDGASLGLLWPAGTPEWWHTADKRGD